MKWVVITAAISIDSYGHCYNFPPRSVDGMGMYGIVIISPPGVLMDGIVIIFSQGLSVYFNTVAKVS